MIDAAREAGVELFAYTSVTDAPANPMGLARVHRDTEAALAASGLPVALLRNGWYTENHTGTLRDAVARGVLAGSAGTGRIAFASRAELAEAAARVLTLDGQGGRVYDLTGDTAWTLAEGAARPRRRGPRWPTRTCRPRRTTGSSPRPACRPPPSS